MQPGYWGVAVIAAVVSAVAVPADAAAKKRSASRPALVTARLECFKQYGGYYNQVTKRWEFLTGPQGSAWVDAVNRCIAQRTGTPLTNYLQTLSSYR